MVLIKEIRKDQRTTGSNIEKHFSGKSGISYSDRIYQENIRKTFLIKFQGMIEVTVI